MSGLPNLSKEKYEALIYAEDEHDMISDVGLIYRGDDTQLFLKNAKEKIEATEGLDFFSEEITDKGNMSRYAFHKGPEDITFIIPIKEKRIEHICERCIGIDIITKQSEVDSLLDVDFYMRYLSKSNELRHYLITNGLEFLKNCNIPFNFKN